jgi:hypothetical protein
LISPALSIPTGLSDLVFRFFNFQDLESDPPNCWDGGSLEVSTNGNAGPFVQIGNALLSDPYEGTINTGNNPISGLLAWCGQPQPYTDARVDISGLAGEGNVVFRFRLGTDGAVGTPGWDIDNVTIQGCTTVLEYADGFENAEN